jgi:hypothetical protein
MAGDRESQLARSAMLAMLFLKRKEFSTGRGPPENSATGDLDMIEIARFRG